MPVKDSLLRDMSDNWSSLGSKQWDWSSRSLVDTNPV